MSEEKDEDDKITKDEILNYVYEYGLYAALGITIGLVANMILKAFI